MSMSLSPRVALVTGGAKRVGRAIALELAQAGCDVAIHHRRDPTSAQSVAQDVTSLGRRAITVPGELTDGASWPAIIEDTLRGLGRLDVLVNNAAAFLTETPDTVEGFVPKVWEVMFRTNVIAVMGLCHHARTHLADSGRGVIINLCDIAADRPWPAHLAYCSSKAALVNLTRGLARALAPSILVNGVAPGACIFPESYDSELRRRIISQVPLGRAAEPGEIAKLVRFLAVEGDYITGQIIAVDGGRSVR